MKKQINTKTYVIWSDYCDEFLTERLDRTELSEWLEDNSDIGEDYMDSLVIYELIPSKLGIRKKLEIIGE